MQRRMSSSVRSTVLVLVLAAAVVAVRLSAPPAVVTPRAVAFAAPTQASRAQTFTFVGVAPGDQRAILTAVARANPEARRLIDAVAGLVTVRVAGVGPDAAGVTRADATGYDLTLDLDAVARMLGPRGIDRLVLHELGHVVDEALVPDAMLIALDAGIPAGYGCDHGRLGGCTAPVERFAESFAKWAMDDIGVNLDIGYKVPPPSLPLAVWAAPLTRLAR